MARPRGTPARRERASPTASQPPAPRRQGRRRRQQGPAIVARCGVQDRTGSSMAMMVRSLSGEPTDGGIAMPGDKIRFALIGLDHNHVYNHARILLNAGAEFVTYYSDK